MNIRNDKWQPWWARLASLAFVLVLGGSSWAHADSWNDKTILTFTAPIMVPGATLPPGEYVFRLMDLKSNRHVVQVLDRDERRVLATTHAIPVKRQDTKGTTTLTFNPTGSDAPPALKAWYYPGSIYGHEFIYPEDQAREIATRQKTIVLSDDAAEGTAAKGTLRQYSADGSFRPWQSDDAVIREWTTWSESMKARARTATDAAREDTARAATAPLVDTEPNAMHVRLNELEETPRKYTGKTITVDAEVEKVLGPRLFTIDEPSWADLDGEILVHMPTVLATLVRPDDRITVKGIVRPFVEAELEKEWRWFDDEIDVSLEWSRRPVLVATRVVGGDNDRALVIAREPASASASAAADEPIGRLTAITAAAVGRSVELEDVKVARVVPGRGFIVSSGSHQVFVRPSDGRMDEVTSGQTVSLDGFVLALPPGAGDEVLGERSSDDAQVYVYATEIG